MTVFRNSQGNETFTGSNEYDQVDYEGSLSDYTFTQNNDGSVTVSHPNFGTDTLTSIEGVWFFGESQWYSIEDAVALTGSGNGGVAPAVSADDDFIIGTNADETFFVGQGNDFIDGAGGQDVLNVDGEAIEWNFTTLDDGTLVMTHPTWGQNTLTNIESIFFARSGVTRTVADAIAVTAGLPLQRLDSDNVLNGTNGDDFISDAGGITGLYGGVGDDTFQGVDGNFSQVNYDGNRSEFNISENADGSLAVVHPTWGEPGADGAVTGDFEFLAVDDIVFDAPIVAPVTPTPSTPVTPVAPIAPPVAPVTPVAPVEVETGDTLIAGAGDQFLEGSAGADTLVTAASGNDYLLGGKGADVFSLREVEDGVVSYDTIADFQSGVDIIDVSALQNVSSFEDLNIVENGNGSVSIYIDAHNSVTFTNLSNLSASDFSFEGQVAVAPTTGGSEPHFVTGDNGNNVLDGGSGSDVINGGKGDDNIGGADGADIIIGGAGNVICDRF